MEGRIETRVSPEQVWKAWESAHANRGEQGIIEGQVGLSKGEHSKGFRYQIVDVVHGERFSILWKTLFIRLLFSHCVFRTQRGAEILYQVQIKGFFAWPIRRLLNRKIRQNIRVALETMVYKLEEAHFRQSSR